jgi:hypothetical protein
MEVAMDISTVTTDATADANARRRARLLAVAGATGAALALWAVVTQALGLDLRGPAFGADAEPSDVGPAQVLIGSLLASLAGWGLLAVLERVTARARGPWMLVAVVVLIGSLGGPVGHRCHHGGQGVARGAPPRGRRCPDPTSVPNVAGASRSIHVEDTRASNGRAPRILDG